VKWVKTVVLTAAMAVVAYGVWSTLTRGPKKDDNAAFSSAPPFNAKKTDDASEGKHVVAPQDTGEAAPPSLDQEMPDGTTASEGSDDTLAPPPAEESSTSSAVGERYQPQDTGVESGVAVASDHDAAEPVSTQPTAADAEYALAMQSIDALLNQGRLAEAHLALSQWYGRHSELSADVAAQMADLLDRLTGTVVYSREDHLQPAHIVLDGETAAQIAQKYNVPWELLAKINDVHDPSALRPGDRLKVVTGPFRAEIDTQKYELVLFLPDGRYAGKFVIGVGKELPPKQGEFEVVKKMENPPYYPPVQNMPVIAGGDPRNPLGKLLLQVGKEMGIHGTNDPANLGKACETGCISLAEKDIDDVYDILAAGSVVKVVR
jgi:hypothetical protein